MMTKISKHMCKCGKGMRSMLTYKNVCVSFYCDHCGRAVTMFPKEVWFEHENLGKENIGDWKIESRDK